MSMDDHSYSAPNNSPGRGEGRRRSLDSRPEVWLTLRYAIDSSARTLRLISILIASNLTVAVVVLFGRYAIDFFKTHSGAATAITVGVVSAALGSAIGLTVAYRRRRTNIKELRELERAVESTRKAEGAAQVGMDAEPGADGATQ